MSAYHARRQRVLYRLAELHPDEYADLMALERIAEGLGPGRDWTPGRTTHGTHAGYMWHRRHGEKPCDPCRLAENAYQRDYRRRKAAA